MTDLNDTTLVDQAHNGNIKAIGDLYDRYQPRIYKYIRARVYDHHKAQDLTGEVFLLMVKNLPTYQDVGVPFSAWLYRIAHNLLVNHIKKENRTELLPISYANNNNHHVGNPTDVLERQMTIESLVMALDKLEDIQREVIILRFIANLPIKEVAQIVDKTVAAVKALQHRGLLALKNNMDIKAI